MCQGEWMSNLFTLSGALGFAIFMILLFAFPLFAFFLAVGYFAMKEFTNSKSKNTNFK